MAKSRPQFTPEEKHSILQEAERQGVSETACKYNIAHSMLSYSKKTYLSNGKEGLKANYKKVDPEVRALEDENARLKKIIANQALELEFKTGLLKKSDAHCEESRAMIALYKDKVDVALLCEWTGIAKSSLYYQSHPGVRGIRSSTHTPIGDYGLVTNELVVEQIRAVLSMDYCVYGYRKMTKELQDMEYDINHKKVYRLMKEHKLLCGTRIRVQGKRKWVNHRRIDAKFPMEYLCLDIKYVWVEGDKRHYYQLAIMDVYSRRILCWIFQRSVRQNDVIALMRMLDLRFGLKGVIIRNDNGSQFIANSVRQVLIALEAKQEFTHVATPEENAYIEAFHSIEQRELIDRHSFESFYDPKQHIEKYMLWYNTKRKHGAIGYVTPMQKWAEGMFRKAVRQPIALGTVDLSRPDSDGLCAESALYSLDKSNEPAYLRLTADRNENELVANLFIKSVQLNGG